MKGRELKRRGEISLPHEKKGKEGKNWKSTKTTPLPISFLPSSPLQCRAACNKPAARITVCILWSHPFTQHGFQDHGPNLVAHLLNQLITRHLHCHLFTRSLTAQPLVISTTSCLPDHIVPPPSLTRLITHSLPTTCEVIMKVQMKRRVVRFFAQLSLKIPSSTQLWVEVFGVKRGSAEQIWNRFHGIFCLWK